MGKSGDLRRAQRGAKMRSDYIAGRAGLQNLSAEGVSGPSSDSPVYAPMPLHVIPIPGKPGRRCRLGGHHEPAEEAGTRVVAAIEVESVAV